MAGLWQKELFEGYGDGTLRPATTLTRAQMAKLLTILDQNF
ncbi:MAG: S-layer homology domain-containing protein [Oscillospiraceae bacterium]